jgi:hypothetical protein
MASAGMRLTGKSKGRSWFVSNLETAKEGEDRCTRELQPKYSNPEHTGEAQGGRREEGGGRGRGVALGRQEELLCALTRKGSM